MFFGGAKRASGDRRQAAGVQRGSALQSDGQVRSNGNEPEWLRDEEEDV
jgi:hypothetical protein